MRHSFGKLCGSSVWAHVASLSCSTTVSGVHLDVPWCILLGSAGLKFRVARLGSLFRN